ncbi:MAG: alpha-amylase/4-alpha-glucanotransferase domain-containing protein [bacterium]
MKKINIAFGIHNHQPVGNFDFVFEEAYKKAYSPFLELLERHPKIRMAQHYTGILLQWLLEHEPEFVPRLRKLVETGQIEMMTGGFYEPIVSVIPDRDKVGQIKKLTDFIKEHTGYEPEGMWLAERIWEPHLPKPCAEAGVKYLVLDDSHFKNAGLRDAELLGYHITEEEGEKVYLFPISEKLRYTIPFEAPETTIDYLRSIATEAGDRLIVFADDGEKFGIWPETHKHCYEDGWLELFFRALENNADWINIIHLSEALEVLRPAGRIYLPTASYREMMEWAMPTSAIHEYMQFEDTLKAQGWHEKYKVFVRAGFWRNFLVKYPESNNMHKKMLHVSHRLAALAARHGADPRFQQAQDHLWASQCNCPYWHGVFGGLYLNHLRYATYNQLIKTERLLDVLERGAERTSWIDCIEKDFDGDGSDEILISTPKLNLNLSPQNGGSVFELDFKPAAINLLDTMTRREEGYHKALRAAAAASQESEPTGEHGDNVASIHDMVRMKEKGLETHLFFDWYRRASCIDHFLGAGTTLRGLSQCDYAEAGDFVQSPYSYAVERSDSQLAVHLWREGRVETDGGDVPVYLEKKLSVQGEGAEIGISYTIKNLGHRACSLWFGAEWDFALLAGDAPDRYYQIPGHELADPRLRSSGEVAEVPELRLVDEWLELMIVMRIDPVATLWRFPIETISQSEGGFERIYQSSVVLPNWRIKLKPNERWQAHLGLTPEVFRNSPA